MGCRARVAHLQATVLQDDRTPERATADNDLLCPDDHISHDLLLVRPVHVGISTTTRPGANDTHSLLLPALIKQHPLHLKTLDKLGAISRRIWEPAVHGAFLLSGRAAQGTMAISMCTLTRVLRHLLRRPAQLPRPLDQQRIAVVRLEVLMHAHLAAHAVQAVLELLSAEEVEPPLAHPLVAHEALRL